MEEKATLRRLYAQKRAAFSNREEADRALQSHLFSLPAWREAPLLCGFLPVRSEPDTRPALEHALADGKALALPVTLTDAREGRMVFRRVRGLTSPYVETARYGLSEPSAACPTLSWDELSHALILVPALAFDDGGYRLGYGGGYYDRFLQELNARRIPHTTVGLTFSVCRPAILPREAFDRPVDYILDERRITVTHGTS